jgi:hypothetical protein
VRAALGQGTPEDVADDLSSGTPWSYKEHARDDVLRRSGASGEDGCAVGSYSIEKKGEGKAPTPPDLLTAKPLLSGVAGMLSMESSF